MRPASVASVAHAFRQTVWRLRSAEEAHVRSSETFLIPSRGVRRDLHVGDLAKLLVEGTTGGREIVVERMWVEVTDATDGRYRGVLRNTPFLIEIPASTVIEFGPEHVAAYASPPRRRSS